MAADRPARPKCFSLQIRRDRVYAPHALYRTNLPIQPTPLIGRERELDEAGALLASHRLLTLTGPGGSGKTRLALQLAAEATEQFSDRAFWVPLQALRDPALVESAIAASIGADGDLVEWVANKRLSCSSTTSSRSWRPLPPYRRCSRARRERRCS